MLDLGTVVVERKVSCSAARTANSSLTVEYWRCDHSLSNFDVGRRRFYLCCVSTFWSCGESEQPSRPPMLSLLHARHELCIIMSFLTFSSALWHDFTAKATADLSLVLQKSSRSACASWTSWPIKCHCYSQQFWQNASMQSLRWCSMTRDSKSGWANFSAFQNLTSYSNSNYRSRKITNVAHTISKMFFVVRSHILKTIRQNQVKD